MKKLAFFVIFIQSWLWVFAGGVKGAVTLGSGLSVFGTYTDNLTFVENDKLEDYGVFVVPRITLGYESADVVFRATYFGNAQFYAENSDRNGYFQSANFLIDLPFLEKRAKGLTVQLTETFNFSPQLQGFNFSNAGDPGVVGLGNVGSAAAAGTASTLGQAGLSGNNSGFGGIGGGANNQGVFLNRSDAFINVAGVRLGYAFSPRVEPFVSYLNRYIDFTSSEFTDSMNHTMLLGSNYAWSPTTTLIGTYGLSYSNFFGGETTNDNFVSHSFRVGMTQIYSPTITFTSTMGASLTQERINFNTSTTMSANFDIGVFVVSYNQSIQPGGGLAGQPTLNRTVVATWNQQFTERLSWWLSGGAAGNSSITGTEIDALSWQTNTGLSLVILEWLSGNASYTHVSQTSDGTFGVEASVNQAFVGLTATVPDWRLMP